MAHDRRRSARTRNIPWALTALCCAQAGVAWGQTAATPPAAAASEPAAGATQLSTVIVTGQGRSQQLQTVPIAIQVVTAEQIKKLASANLGDMNGTIPGLVVDNTQPTQPFFSLRGIGTGDFGIGTDAPVGVYVDGVYTGKTGGALMNFNDVKRIEVLKGPQGTLFGRNSAGGAISVVTNDPTGVLTTNGLVRFGNHRLVQAEVIHDRPLGDDLALRISAVSRHGGDWISDAASGQKYGGNTAWGSRVGLRWNASDATSAVLTWEHEKLDQKARPAIGLLAVPTYGADPQTYLDPRKAPLFNDAIGNRETRSFDGLRLRIERTLPIGEFTSTTAYRHFTSLNREDNDGTNRITSYLDTANIEGNTTWQQEFRLAGRNARVDWLVGASLFYEKARQTSQINTFTDSLDTLFTNVAGVAPFATVTQLAADNGVPGINLLGQSWQESMINAGRYKALAVYGDTIWHLTPATNLTTGIRFTRDEKRFSWFSPSRTAAGLDDQLAVLDAVGLLGALPPELAALLTQNQLINGQGASTAPLEVTRSWSDVSPRLVIDHRYGPNLMTYASVTRGYQSGGYNALAVNGSYEPEHVTSYELGAKGQWPEQGLAFAVALFQYRFDNLQSLSLVPSGNQAGVPAYQVTVSDQRATGLDAEARWQPSRGLRFFGAAEVIDQTYRHRVSAAGVDLSGQPVGTPRLTATTGVDLSWASAGGSASLALQASYTGATRCNDDSLAQGQCLTTPNFRVGAAMQRLDARIGWETASHGFGVALVVNNLLDKRYVTSISTVAAGLGAPYATISPPRSVMLELKASL